ncbi:nSTAND1 domain-containing NTPase [Streptomyces sp. H39-S7]|uniref:nSTAND1 domain-containing NTPase n=1 Tax=Streptomyces sp. H39-S7 TaxID=3004357 RepID=UPI0022B06138|nr:hypothetical protein [Streptomyces sp. H39-S7]MCZ4125138.1 hypothetical protein [Streptomyces sp. H39-S7]
MTPATNGQADSEGAQDPEGSDAADGRLGPDDAHHARDPDEPAPAGEPVLRAEATEQGRVVQARRDLYYAERDLHLHYRDGVRAARRTEAGRQAEAHECPYPGLAAFDEDRAHWFFGRDSLTAELLVGLDERLQVGGPIAVVAPSGAGKSSLLRAGLLPAIARGALPAAGSARWPRVLLTPTAHPVAALTARRPSSPWWAGPWTDAARTVRAPRMNRAPAYDWYWWSTSSKNSSRCARTRRNDRRSSTS